MKPGVVMSTLLVVLQVVVALMLISVILIQEPKSTGGGLFSGTGQSLLGTSGKTFWVKFTTGLAVFFFALCLLLAALPKYHTTGSSLADQIQQQQQQSADAAAAAASQAAPKTDTGVPAKAPAPQPATGNPKP